MAINYEAAFEYFIFMVRFSDMPNILLSNTDLTVSLHLVWFCFHDGRNVKSSLKYIWMLFLAKKVKVFFSRHTLLVPPFTAMGTGNSNLALHHSTCYVDHSRRHQQSSSSQKP